MNGKKKVIILPLKCCKVLKNEFFLHFFTKYLHMSKIFCTFATDLERRKKLIVLHTRDYNFRTICLSRL